MSGGPKRVVLESPYAGNVERNKMYLERCMRNSLRLGESPFASHRMFTAALDDTVPAERELGLAAGFAWYAAAEACVVYIDHGISDGMKRGIAHAESLGMPVELRRIGA